MKLQTMLRNYTSSVGYAKSAGSTSTKSSQTQSSTSTRATAVRTDSYSLSAEAKASLEKSNGTATDEVVDETTVKKPENNSSFSDEVYEKIIELAKRDAHTGDYMGGRKNNDIHDLMRPEVMKRGPDRSGLQRLFGPILSSVFGNGSTNILNMIVNLNGFSASMHGGNQYQGSPPWMIISDKNGEECMHYIHGQWDVCYTKTEQKADAEWTAIYADAFDKERAKMYVEGTPYENGKPVPTPQSHYLAEALANQANGQ